MSSGYSFMPPSSLRGDSLRRVAANLTEPWRWTFLSCSMCLFMCSVRMCVQRFHASRVSCMHPCACGRLLFQSACTCTTCGTRSQTVTYWNACGLLCVAFPSLKGLVDLNADCHDVSSKPQRCLLCVTVTIYFRRVCEKKKTSFPSSRFTDMDGQIETLRYCSRARTATQMDALVNFRAHPASQKQSGGTKTHARRAAGWQSHYLTSGHVLICVNNSNLGDLGK